jgi:hypothetical protein
MYDHIGIPIALEGAIGVDRHLLLVEYADGITQSASFRLDPTLKDGEIIVDGLWFARGKPEGNRVRAAGRSTLAITPASRTQR